MGGFDLDAARAVAGSGEVERYQVLDQLTLLVDKSLVLTEENTGSTRYRLLETVRQYALEKLGESGEADAVRTRHRDHYTSAVALLDTPGTSGQQERLEQTEIDVDNLRAAFTWSRERSDAESALKLASSLQRLYVRSTINGQMVPLSSLMKSEVSVSPLTINHQVQRARAVRGDQARD